MDNKKDIQDDGKPYIHRDYLHLNKEYVLKRVEKIAGALHLLTANLEAAEPFRSMLRSAALRLLEETLLLRVSSSSSVLYTILESFSKILSLLETARIGGIVSDFNVAIVAGEINRTKEFLEERFEELKEKLSLPPDFFKEVGEGDTALEEERGRAKSLWGETQTTKSQLSLKKTFIGHKDMSYKKMLGTKSKMTDMDADKKRENKVLRREKIIDVVKSKGQVSIKDITSYFSEYSEKTIQRELLSLVSKGVFKKEGERRWSKYSLNTF